MTTYKLTPAECENVAHNGAMALLDYCMDYKLHYLVTGASGGLDSSATLGFAERACKYAQEQGYPLFSVGLIMPCHSSPESTELGRLAIQTFHAHEVSIDLNEQFDLAMERLVPKVDEQVLAILEKTGGQKALKNWEWSRQVAQGNIRARLRMIFGTYHVARMLEGMVLSTDNLSELWMAFWTIGGDVGDFALIQHVLKGLELYDIARHLGTPEPILVRKPTDDLGVTEGGDEAQLGTTYPELDTIMIKLVQAGFDPDDSKDQLQNLPAIGHPAELVQSLACRCLNGAHKRRGTFIVTRRQLGLKPIHEIQI